MKGLDSRVPIPQTIPFKSSFVDADVAIILLRLEVFFSVSFQS